MKKWALAALIAICLMLPGQPSIARAAGQGWVYDHETQTLTNGSTTIESVSANGDNLTIGRNMAKDFIDLDLSGNITDEDGYAYHITKLDSFAFWECTQLRSIILPDSLTSIGPSAFFVCPSLETLDIPDRVTFIGESAFSNCGIRTIHLPRNLDSIPPKLFRLSGNLYELEIPRNVKSIGDSAFEDCWQLSSINLPSATTIIGSSAFSGCYNLVEANIAGSLKSIGDSAFLKCGTLTTINVSATIPSSMMGTGTFEGCRNLHSIVVPAASLNAYKTNSDWKPYKNKLKPGYFLTLNGDPYQGKLYLEDEEVSVPAPEIGPCQDIDHWEVTGTSQFKDEWVLRVTMPANDVSVTPIYKERHSWTAAFWDWSLDGKACKLTLTCHNTGADGHSKLLAAHVSSSVKIPASCFSKGVTEYTATVNIDGKNFTSTTQRTDISAKHNWGEPEWTWSEDRRSCEAAFACTNDPSHAETVEAEVTSAVKTPATCTENGVTAYTATAEHEGETFTATAERTDVPATGHTFENGTCTECGAKDPNHKPGEEPVAPEGGTGDSSRPGAPNDPDSKPSDNQIENPGNGQVGQGGNGRPENQDNQSVSSGDEALVQTGDASLAFAAASCLGGLIAAAGISMRKRTN